MQRVEEVDDLKAENEKLVNELAELEGIERDFKIVSETLAVSMLF